MPGFNLTYNGLTFNGILTKLFKQEPARDESNTDTWYDKFTITIETIANIAVFLNENRFLGITGEKVQTAESAARVCLNIQALLEDRKPFTYSQDGIILVASDAMMDANNGPRVVEKTVTPMGRNSFRVHITFEVARIVCTTTPSPVISNRWVVIDDVDDQWRTTRVWRGKLRLSSAVHNPQSFRGMVIPNLSDGFQRKRMHFEGGLNALELSYEVVDQQLLGDAPPDPAVRMSGEHTESLSQNGSSSIGQITVRLDGRPGIDKHDLLRRCMQIINSRVQAEKFKSKANWRWLELNLTDYLGDVLAVQASAKIERAVDLNDSPSEALQLGNMLLETFARPLDLGEGYVRYRTIPPGAYPCSTVGLFACHLQSPCANEHSIPKGAEYVSPGEEKPENEASEHPVATYDPTGSSIDIDSPGYSQDHSEAMYTFSRVNWSYDIDEGFVALPYGEALPNSKKKTAFVRLHGGYSKVTAVVAAERIGDWPKIPKKSRFIDKSGIEYVPLKYRPTFQPPEYQGDGRKLHTIDLTIVYGMDRPPEDNEYTIPALPWDDQPETTVPTTVFQSKV